MNHDRRAVADRDLRTGRVLPTAAQRRAAASLGADTVRWNRFGTPRVLRDAAGAPLAAGLSANPRKAARQFLRRNARIFRLQRADVGRLQLVNASKVGRHGRVILLRQRFGALRPTLDGLVTVAVKRGKVLYASSTLTGNDAAPPATTLSPVAAYRRLADHLNRPVGTITAVKFNDRGWTTFKAAGSQVLQRVRLTALPMYGAASRPAFEVWYTDPGDERHGTKAYKAYVDGVDGSVLFRKDVVLNAVGCGEGDEAPTSNSDAGHPNWCVFPANPPIGNTPTDYPSTDTRQVWCWVFSTGCARTLNNEAPRADQYGEWDRGILTTPAVNFFPPTFTTIGNNANTSRAWLSPFTPAEQVRPISLARDYRYAWTDEWNQAKCNPSVFVNLVNGNDTDPAVTNLFAQHNRMHDWSYFLGYTERNYNQQSSNQGRGPSNGSTETRELDPQIGNAQAGALTGGYPTYLGRDNANQIPTPDGVPPISNMYLWQPLKSVFYAPCVDGDYDMSIIGHEYAHAISNRMVAGPDAGLDQGEQAGAMGESWSDLIGVEYLHEFNLVPTSDEDPWAVGPYATGNKFKGIRNYPLDDNPLNFSDIGYDTPGVEVHSDGEIWNAVNFDLRQAFVGRYGDATPAVQAQCASGRRTASVCPGNRRWMQLVFDSFLLMQNNVDMLDARDAFLVADEMRFAGRNQDIIWEAFAKRGFGVNAQTIGGDDPDPLANFVSPVHSNATLLFVPTSKDGGPAPQDVEFFVGDYEGDVSPVADTVANDPNDPQPRSNAARFVPGTYRFIARADGHGAVRFTRTLAAGQSTTVTVPMPRNLASVANGATATGTGADAIENLLDDTEETSWRSDGPPADQNRVFVDLAGDAPHTIRQVKVSAFPNPVDEDPFTGERIGRNRFTTVRQFEVKVCTQTALNPCLLDAQYTSVYTSPPDAFPARAPRPVAPDLILRSFVLPEAAQATHVQFHVLENQCTGVELFRTDYDEDPLNDPRCDRPSDPISQDGGQTSNQVTAAEFQVNAVTG